MKAMARASSRSTLRAIHHRLFDSGGTGVARCFTSGTPFLHLSSLPRPHGGTADVLVNSCLSPTSTRCRESLRRFHSSLLESRVASGWTFRRCDVAISCSPRPSQPFYLGMARSFFSRPPDKTSTTSPTQPAVDSLTNSPGDSSSIPKEDMQGGTKELVEMARNAMNSVGEATTATISWVQQTTQNIIPIIKEWFDPSEYMSVTLTELVYTTVGAMLAWFVMPRLFRRFHRYFEDGPPGRFWKRTPMEKVPYDLSFWAALEDPARILITVIAFSQLGALVAPNTIATHYLEQIWKGGAVVGLVWFLHRWKSNVFSRLLAGPAMSGAERERYLALDKISSMGILVLGGMALAETCGLAVQSILTVGGIGGVATAFAARDILGNVLSGFALQFSKPFSIGDIIKAGSIEGQVLDIGLTATHMLDTEKFPVAVPNSFFSSQVIVNKSRARWRTFSVKIPVQLKDYEKIPQITQEVRDMLKNHPKVYLDSGVPHCFVSRVGSTSMEISVQCNLNLMAKEELLSTEQDIILEAVKIVASSGATLGVPEI